MPLSSSRSLLSPYRAVFRAPGAVAFTLTGCTARLGVSMLGVGNVVMIATVRGSYALAGAVSAASVVAAALASPFLGRLVDRRGQARTARPAVLLFALGAAAMLLCVRFDAPVWTLFVCCAASAGTPSTGSMTRARWAWVHRDDPDARHAANSFEQVVDEVCFMAGPVLAMLLCTAAFPEAGLLVAACLLVAGSLLFTARRDTEPPPHPRGSAPGAPPLGVPGLRVVAGTFLFTGAVFGSLEVATIAAVDALGAGSAGGAFLALQAAGSCAAGLAFGAARPRRSAPARFLLGVAAMAAAVPTLLLAGSLPLLAVLLFTVGVATAPTMVTGMTLVQDVLPASRLNEGMTTVYTALLIGISAGAAAGGWTAEHHSPEAAYAVPAAAALGALAAAAAGRPFLLRPPAPLPPARTPGGAHPPRRTGRTNSETP